MSDSEHDDEFEAYLKRRVPIQKGPAAPDRLEPPPELDRIIIGNARKAIQGAAPVPVYRAPRWALAAGLAATIVISLAVVLELGLRAKHAAPPEEPVETDLVAEAPTPDAMPAPAMALQGPTLQDPSVAKPSGAAKSGGARVAPRVAKRIKLPPIPTIHWPPTATPNMAPTMAADGGEQAAAAKARTRLARAEAAASRTRSDVIEGVPTGTAEASSVEPMSAVPAGEAYAAAKPGAADSGNSTLEEVVVTHKGSRSRSPSPAAAPPAPPAHPDAATWLVQIEKLRTEGQMVEAERQIKLFRALYPDYPLPRALAFR